ncbi:unnamed protein product [Malus baccata var. baccata]
MRTTLLRGRSQSGKTNENDLKILSFNNKDKIKGKVNSTMIDFLRKRNHYESQVSCHHQIFIVQKFTCKRKTNEKGLKILSFNDKDKIKGKVNSIRFDFLV